MQVTLNRDLCRDCVLSVSRKRRTTLLLLLIITTLIVLVVLHVSGYRAADVVDYFRLDAEERRLAALVREEPCDGGRTLALVENQMSAGMNRKAILTANRFFDTCGDAPRLRWNTFEAHKRLSEWFQAEEEASKLIEANRYDPDYWWWRGQVREARGRLSDAADDFRMATALCPTCRSAIDLADVLEKDGKPCEAITPLRTLNQSNFEGRNTILSLRIKTLLESSECANYRGTGSGTVRINIGRDGHARVNASINDRDSDVNFLVDTGATTVVLSRALASALELRGPYRRVFVKTANAIAMGDLTTLRTMKVGELIANNIEVTILEGEDVEPLLGMSYLSRFKMTMDSSEIVLGLDP